MNQIELLGEYIRRKYPDATVNLTPPLLADGVWSLDIDKDEDHLAVEWSANTRFGLSSVSQDTYGEGADETIATLADAKGRIDQLIATTERTAPPPNVLLARLRELRGFTQKELAGKLGVAQATISGMEHRRDFQISTLKRVIEAIGGSLEVFSVFPGARYRIFPPGEDIPTAAIEPDPSMSPAIPEASKIDKLVGASAGAHPHAGTETSNDDLNKKDDPSAKFSVQKDLVATIARRETEYVLDGLREMGELTRAYEIADLIKTRHSVLEIP